MVCRFCSRSSFNSRLREEATRIVVDHIRLSRVSTHASVRRRLPCSRL